MTDTMNIPDSFEYHCLTINITKTEETYKNLLSQAFGFNETRHLLLSIYRYVGGRHI